MFELVLVVLFIALTPGILFKMKGSKMVSAGIHAALFGVVVYVVSVYFMSYDGFRSMAPRDKRPEPICPNDGHYNRNQKHCLTSGICPDGYMGTGKVCSKRVEPQCPEGYTFEKEAGIFANGDCVKSISSTCLTPYVMGEYGCTSVPISCPEPYILTNGDCIAPTQTTAAMTTLVPNKMNTTAPGVPTSPTLLSSIADKNGNTIKVGSTASCKGGIRTLVITVTRIESRPNSTIIRGKDSDNKVRAYRLTSCVAT